MSILDNIPSVYVNTQRLTVTRDVGDGPVDSYANYLTNIKMSVQFNDGSETTGVTISGRKTGSAYCNYQDIIETDRIVYNGRVFEVTAAYDQNELHVFMELKIAEVNPSDL